VRQLEPLLLAMGLSPELTLPDQVLRNHALPVLRSTHRPLLLIPENSPPPALPRRLALAVDAESFTLCAAARAATPLLQAWRAAVTVVHVLAANEQQAFPGQRALAHVRRSGLLPDQPLELYEETGVPAAAGVLQAVADTQAEMLVLIARPRSFLGHLFHRSVTAQVLRHATVPVLLLPAVAATKPDWLPDLS
jgi:nucleotide-binding universal stress UspA family protein